MALVGANFEKDACKLIKHLTGFKERYENFQICQNFVLSNFKFHRFLDVDSHKVTRAVDGIRQKLIIHSQPEKADSFVKLVDKFLESPDIGGKQKSDAHYSLLSLLLLLSDSPTKDPYVEPIAEQIEEEDPFDWAAYLQEGEDPIQRFSDSDLSDEDLYDDDDARQLSLSDHGDSGVQASGSIQTSSCTPARPVEILSSEVSQNWLRENLVTQYWKEEFMSRSHLTSEWKLQLAQCNPFYISTPEYPVTESQLLREIVWLLSGVEKLFIFRFDGKHYTVHPDLHVTHLTSVTLVTTLGKICLVADKLYALRQFVDNVTEKVTSGEYSQTYEAFARSLMPWLQGLHRKLLHAEKLVKKQEETATMSMIMSDLAVDFQHVELLYALYEQGIETCRDKESHAEKVCQLINVLYEALLSVYEYGGLEENRIQLLFPIWLQTIRPYIKLVDNWITTGNLCDPYNEFIIVKNPEISPEDHQFWMNSFSIQASIVNSVPCFLQSFINEIILTGKSMDVMERLGKLQLVVQMKGPQNLYQHFLAEFGQILGQKDEKDEMVSVQTLKPFGGQIGKHVEQLSVHDTLLEINFKAIFNAKEYVSERLYKAEEKTERQLSKLDIRNSLSPIELVIQECLYPSIRDRYQFVCHQFLAVLREQYHLDRHLTNMRNFFLMAAGDTMYDFYTELFDKLRLNEMWDDLSFLNALMDDSLQQKFPQEINRLTVDIEETTLSTKTQYPINALNKLRLHYKVPWVVSLVINSASQNVYNQIFKFVLQIKRAKHSLDLLRFSDLMCERSEKHLPDETFTSLYQTVESYRGDMVHRMMLLRQRLMHFVNNVHDYIMTSILHSTGLEFQKDVAIATDLDQVIQIHNAYITKIHERCMLTRNVALLKEAVMKVLNLSIHFQSLWDSGICSVTVKTLSDMETDFLRCVHFLSSFLQNVIKRGSFPHLESLTFFLISSDPNKSK